MLRSVFTLAIRPVYIHKRLSEWHLAFVMAMVGGLFLLAPTFELPPYTLVRQIASQPVWGWSMFSLGVIRVVVLFINGAWSHSPHLRSGLSSISAMVWSFMFAGLMAYDTPMQLGPFILAAIVVELISAYRAAQDARAEDESGAHDGSTS